MEFETYDILQGKIMIAFSDKTLSVGTLELKPKQELARHSRPVLESLFQIRGACAIKFDDGEVILKEGEAINIKSNRFHIHSNPFNEVSITFWKASGDITKIINSIRKNSEM